MIDTNTLARILERNLTEEEESQVQLFEKGRALSDIRRTLGFDVILEMLQSYVAKAAQRCMETDPAQKDEAAANQAVAYAINRLYVAFKQDVDEAIEASHRPPEVILEQLQHATVAPPEGV